nr:transporter substrate-binding domain-containing protein [uncultured Pseudomonas sp.]
MRLLLLITLLMAYPPLHAEQWRVVGDAQAAPYSFIVEGNDKPLGLDVELVKAVLDEIGIPYTMRLYPWERVVHMLDRGEADIGFQFIGSPERMRQYELAGPLRIGSTVFMTTYKTAIRDWHEFADLTPYVIGQVRGYTYQSAYDKAVLTRDTSAHTPNQLVSMLLAGRIGIIVGDRDQLMYFIREQHAEGSVRILPTPLVEMPRYVAFAKGDSARAAQFSSTLERLRQSGALSVIYRRWQQ